MDDQPLTPAQAVKRLRLNAGSHDKFAKQLGTSRQTIIAWEKGRKISDEYALKLAQVSEWPLETFAPITEEEFDLMPIGRLVAAVADNPDLLQQPAVHEALARVADSLDRLSSVLRLALARTA